MVLQLLLLIEVQCSGPNILFHMNIKIDQRPLMRIFLIHWQELYQTIRASNTYRMSKMSCPFLFNGYAMKIEQEFLSELWTRHVGHFNH